MYSTAALAANDVWAVGTITAHFDGARWTVVPAPIPSGAELDSVAILTSNDVWAVGTYQDPKSNLFRPLVLHWNGRAWTAMPVPQVLSGNNLTKGLVAFSDTNVWICGSFDDGGQVRALFERFDGKRWQVVPGANQFDFPYYFLTKLKASGPNDIWAVGSGYEGATQINLAEHWDGVRWSDTNVQTQQGGALWDVIPLSPSNVWAVGNSSTPDGHVHTEAEHWNGRSWTIVPTPRVAPWQQQFLGITGSGPSDLWAFGNADPQNTGSAQMLIEHCNGRSWAVSPAPNAPNSTLFSGALLPDGQLWSVGVQIPGAFTQPLVITTNRG